MMLLEKKMQQDILLALKARKLLILPTETVYGLAAPIDDLELLAKIFSLKERPSFDPLIVHVSCLDEAKSLVSHWPTIAGELAEAFWPGAMTLVLPRRQDKIDDLITAGLDTVGIRYPKHEMALAMIRCVGRPLAAPSANKFTKTSPTEIEHVKSVFSEKDVFFMDGGPCQKGLESTVLKIESDQKVVILRPGPVTLTELQKRFPLTHFAYGPSLLETRAHAKKGQEKKEENAHEAPGQHVVHYRPDWPVIIGEKDRLPSEWATECEIRLLPSDLTLCARELYRLLRTPLASGKTKLFLDTSNIVLKTDLDRDHWHLIVDRLKKAGQFL
jgi:L-threonylcarbamoyladenylate synthase